MKRVILIRFGEIYLKGNNRNYFEKALLRNIQLKLSTINAKISKIYGRYFIENYDVADELQIIERLKTVFGIVSFSVATELDTNIDDIIDFCKNIKINEKTFRVNVKRADKSFTIKSDVFAANLGHEILQSHNNLSVDLHNPELTIDVEIRENKKTYILTEKIYGVGGMPVGTAGHATLLLSGGIDSPVAGYMIAKRGMKLSAIHFHSFPYTSLEAKEKVIKLRDVITKYCGNIKLYICSFTQIQEEIHKNCAPEFMITIMRRIMMRIAEKLSKNIHSQAIITGESLGQVASQTIESITSTNSVLQNIPVLRPLIGMDKIEIIDIATKIGSYDTSILPYEDCCTVFLPKNPLIKPRIADVLKEESKLDIDLLVENALTTIEIV